MGKGKDYQKAPRAEISAFQRTERTGVDREGAGGWHEVVLGVRWGPAGQGLSGKAQDDGGAALRYRAGERRDPTTLSGVLWP